MSYSFFEGNTGQTYNILSTTANRKVLEDDSWSLKVNTISLSSSNKGYGIAFIPIRASRVAGRRQWRKSTGVTYGDFGDYGPVLTTYQLGARSDDDLSGTGRSTGLWNSDYMTNW